MAIIVVLVIVWLASGFYCAAVAESKGHDGISWALGGLFFGFIALIAVAGLPDKKLRKYIRQIGEKQNAIRAEKQNVVLPAGKNDKSKKNSTDKELAFKKFSFKTPINASEDEVYKELVKNLTATEEGKKAFNSIQVDSYGFNKPLLGGAEFILVYAEGKYELILSSTKYSSQRIWRYSN